MSEAQSHTPGPWSVEHISARYRIRVGEFPNHAYVGWGTLEADARLMAAAPELLEACQTFVSAEDAMLADLKAKGEMPDLTANVWPLVDRMRAAIAKATGQ